MKIEGKEAGNTTRRLEEAQGAGYHYVLLEKEKGAEAIRPNSLQFFRKKEDAVCVGILAVRAEGKNVEVLPVQPVLQHLQKQAELHELTARPGTPLPELVVDGNRIRRLEVARQAIFSTEIAQQLREQGYQPDLRQLRENIEKDKQQFEITGFPIGKGSDSPFIIGIEQDANRAFRVGSIVPQKLHERLQSIDAVRQLSEKEIREAFVQTLSHQMAKADWYHDYSDGYAARTKGEAEIHAIREDLRLLSRLDGGLDKAKQLWQQYVPPHSVAEPGFFDNPRQLNTGLASLFMNGDMPKVLELLEEHQNKGNRFVTIDSDPLTVPKNKLLGFPTAVEARSYEYEQSDPERSFVATSITDLQKELRQALGQNKEQALSDVATRLKEHRQEAAPSREHGMSR